MESEDAILKKIREYMNDISDVILTTKLPLEEYRFDQGKIEACAFIERWILDLKIAAEHEPE